MVGQKSLNYAKVFGLRWVSVCSTIECLHYSIITDFLPTGDRFGNHSYITIGYNNLTRFESTVFQSVLEKMVLYVNEGDTFMHLAGSKFIYLLLRISINFIKCHPVDRIFLRLYSHNYIINIVAPEMNLYIETIFANE